MEERLDDAIYVLRHHAEPQQMGGHQGGMMQPSHSNGIMGYPPGGMSNTIEALVREIVVLVQMFTLDVEETKQNKNTHNTKYRT